MQFKDRSYSFLGDRVGGGGGGGGLVGFHSDLIKERLVEFANDILTRKVNEQFHSH